MNFRNLFADGIRLVALELMAPCIGKAQEVRLCSVSGFYFQKDIASGKVFFTNRETQFVIRQQSVRQPFFWKRASRQSISLTLAAPHKFSSHNRYIKLSCIDDVRLDLRRFLRLLCLQLRYSKLYFWPGGNQRGNQGRRDGQAMTDPSITLQTALRGALIDHPAVNALVPADHIRAGSTRPNGTPCIILAAPQTINLGRASGGAYLTRCYIDLHIWAIEDGADMARQIGAAVALALWDSPLPVQDVNEYERPSFRYMRDPDPEQAYCHAVASVSCVVRWSL